MNRVRGWILYALETVRLIAGYYRRWLTLARPSVMGRLLEEQREVGRREVMTEIVEMNRNTNRRTRRAVAKKSKGSGIIHLPR